MANGTFGYCENCQYWDTEAVGELKPCSRINRDGVDVRMDGSSLAAMQQSFSTPAEFGCSLFEAREGVKTETEEPQGNPGYRRPETLDGFLT